MLPFKLHHRPALLLAALLAIVAALPATAMAAAASGGYRTTCGVELSRPAAANPSGPVCGTDEGDDVGFAGEDFARTFFGENGHDTVEGSRYEDRLSGGGGNDEIHGGRGNDRIDGGDDSDTLFGGLGDDVIRERRFGVDERFYGGPGNDVLGGGRGGDYLYGGTGDDVLLGGTGSDYLYGGPGDDRLYGGPNRDTFDCGPGNDTVYRVRVDTDRSSIGRRDAFISRAANCERVVNVDPTADFALRDVLGTTRDDLLVGGPGRELLQGKGGGDRLYGGGGDDELEGDGTTNQGDDLLAGGAGNDRLAGRAGDDKLYGDARDPAAGPPGNDEITGGRGKDLMVGGPGSDLILGAYDNDRILAGAGNDVINLLGGDTSDPGARVNVDCGSGRDVVVINPARRGTYRNCESFAEQFHEADFGFLLRPSPETLPPDVAQAAAAPAARLREDSERRPTAPAPGVSAARTEGRSARQPTPPATPPVPATPPSTPPPSATTPPPIVVAEPDGGASAPSISFDGARVAFSSDAPNLVASDSNGERTDAFVRDLPTTATLLANATRRGAAAERGGRLRRGPHGALSADGRFVALSSNSRDLGTNGNYSIVRRDLARRATRLACRAGNDDSESPSLSADGLHVAFESRATDLDGSDSNQQTDVYWCDLNTGERRRASVPLRDSINSVGTSLQPSLSADGRYVAFVSDGGGLVAGDGERAGVYWRDMVAGETRLVDVPAGSRTSNGNGQNPKISSDGRFVVFDSDATDLPGGDANGSVVDVFRTDMTDGSVALVSQVPDGSRANGDSTADSVNADGNVVAFTSSASNLVEGDGNALADVFVRNVPGAANARVSTTPSGGQLDGLSTGAAVSGNGRYVAFASRAPAVIPGVAAGARTRVYRKDLATGAVDPATAGLDLPPRSLLAEPSGTLPRRRVRLLAGTVEDDGALGRVEVALVRRLGAGRCAWLGRGTRLASGRCDQPRYLRARVTGELRFTLRLGRLLPRGTYELRSRAVDARGQVEQPRPERNVTEFRLE